MYVSMLAKLTEYVRLFFELVATTFIFAKTISCSRNQALTNTPVLPTSEIVTIKSRTILEANSIV